MKSSSKGNSIDGIQCSSCKKHYDIGSVNITEAVLGKLEKDKKVVWKCPTCRISASAPQSPGVPKTSIDAVLTEIREVKSQLSSLPNLVADMHKIKDELKELKTNCRFNSKALDDFDMKLASLESRIINLEQVQRAVKSIQGEMDVIKLKISMDEQRGTKLNNIEITGIPVKNGENLFNSLEKICQTVNFSIPKSQINYIHRVPVPNSKDKTIIVSFLNKFTKEDFIAAFRSFKDLTTQDLGFECTPRPVCIKDPMVDI